MITYIKLAQIKQTMKHINTLTVTTNVSTDSINKLIQTGGPRTNA